MKDFGGQRQEIMHFRGMPTHDRCSVYSLRLKA